MFKQIFSTQDSYHKHTDVHKMYECDKNQMPYCSVKKFKVHKT